MSVMLWGLANRLVFFFFFRGSLLCVRLACNGWCLFFSRVVCFV